ncbi:uncharacterized protein [Asterias amurensis]|uniref:uncharacterized protein n=1 Tax=Asterias amurensis TaxID=7602 RepID=UPI003AB7FE35
MKLHNRKVATNGLFVLIGVLVVATSGYRGGRANGFPIGPRAPDADSGVSTDWQVRNHAGNLDGDADGTAKYSHLGTNPKPAVVDGPLFVETKANLDSVVFPKPGDPSIAGQRRRLREDKTSTHRLNSNHDIGSETESVDCR